MGGPPPQAIDPSIDYHRRERPVPEDSAYRPNDSQQHLQQHQQLQSASLVSRRKELLEVSLCYSPRDCCAGEAVVTTEPASGQHYTTTIVM